MPWGDRTGPAGQGPLSGRRAGYCAGYDVPGYANPGYGGGWGRGRGRGGGGWGRGMAWRHGRGGAWGGVPAPGPAVAPGYLPPQRWTREEEIQELKAQEENLAGSLEDIRARIDQLAEEEDAKE
ncbi:MAG: DUF5320 domain-containing protein [Polyangia bacterium]